MDRKYENGKDSDSVRFFIGKELEKTPVFGAMTLFVVGNESNEEINKRLHFINSDPKRDKITHIYFAANHSYNKFTQFEQINQYLELGYDVTYECTAEMYQHVKNKLPIKNKGSKRRFVVMISAVLPNVFFDANGSNAAIILKIDDKDTDRTNPGVWCLDLEYALNSEDFTDFKEYAKDEILD